MDGIEVPEGIDPKNACRIEVNVSSYFSIRDGKKVYNRGRTVSWVVDSEEYAVIDLENNILGEGYFWDSGQKANFWVLTGHNLTCKLTSDSQLLDLLRSSQLVKFLMIVGSRQRVMRQLNIEDFVHDYYSVERFKMTYQFQITPMNDKSEWPNVDVGFEMVPPPERAAGRPKETKELRLVESQEKEDHINAKGAFSLDI